MSEQWDPEELMREARLSRAPARSPRTARTPGCVPADQVRRGNDRDRLYEEWARCLQRQEDVLTVLRETQEVWRWLLVVWTAVLCLATAWVSWRW